MNTRKTSLRRLAAGVGVLSLALVGFVGGNAASAATGGNAVAGSIDTTLTGSLTINKHESDPQSIAGNILGDPLEGVVFQIEPITNVDLTTEEGWTTIEAAYAPQPTAAPILTGLTLGTATSLTPTNASGVTVEDNLPVGAYYVTEISSGPNIITAPAIPFIITIPEPNANGTWNYNPVAYPKNDVGTVTPTKTVSDPIDGVLGLDKNVDWTISAPLPATSVGYTEFKISDSLDPDLTFVAWQSVSVGATPLTPGTDFSVNPTTHEIMFLAPGLLTLNNALEEGNVTVTAVLRTTVTEVGAHTNVANITVNGNTIPTNEPQTNWGALEIKKVDSENTQEVLGGADFEVYLADTNGDPTGTAIASGTTDATDGTLHFDFYIGSGATTSMTVVVVETVAPQGYVLPDDPTYGPFTITAGSTVTASTVYETIENYEPTAPNLPLTGSTGTMAFTLGGLALIAMGAGMMLVRRTRSHR
ncbi:SpaH/EbpB family LPXTG-anchored major pilin [Leucobacter denitrificans]|uniref:SpaH/EbpB family LPXTG-anchored major pilin n=1 Tax=Leucobacter denitrificans TaxID=683042 RepID=UPI0036163AA6